MSSEKEKLKSVFCEIFDLKQDIAEEELNQEDLIAWDSLNHIRLISEIEKEFSTEFDPDDFFKLNSFESVCEVLKLKD